MPQSDRATVKRKWSADASAGPLVLLGEWLVKRLIQHGWPCAREITWEIAPPVVEGEELQRRAVGLKIVPYPGRGDFGPAFFDALDAVLRVVSHEARVGAYRQGCEIRLDGPYYVNSARKIRRGPMSAPF